MPQYEMTGPIESGEATFGWPVGEVHEKPALVLVGGLFQEGPGGLLELFSEASEITGKFDVLQWTPGPLTFRPAWRLESPDFYANSLRNYLLENEPKYPSITIIAQSLGGIVLKRALVSTDASLLKAKIELIVFIGTPEEGVHSFPRQELSPLPLVARVVPARVSLASFWKGDPGIVKADSEWTRWIKDTSIRVVHVLGVRDSVSPFHPLKHWDTENVYMTPYSHVELMSAVNYPVIGQIVSGVLP